MKYQIHGFQQSEALRLGINDRDLLYLRWFIDFKGTEKMVCHTIKDTHFYWVNYQALIDDHPCLEIKSRETISRRFNKMVESGILIKYLKKDKKGTYTLFAIGPEYLSLADSKKVESKEPAHDIFVESIHPALDKKVDPKDPNTKNINPNTNNINQAKPDSLTTQTKKIFEELNPQMSWVGKEKEYGRNLQLIIKASNNNIDEIKKRAIELKRLIDNKKFIKGRGFTPSTLLSNWNDLIDIGSSIDDEFKEIDRLIEENKRNHNELRQVF